MVADMVRAQLKFEALMVARRGGMSYGGSAGVCRAERQGPVTAFNVTSLVVDWGVAIMPAFNTR